MDSCRAVDTCAKNSSDVSGQLVSSHTPYIFSTTTAYGSDTACTFNYYVDSSDKYYLFEFGKLDIHCEDALKIGDASGMFSYTICSRNSEPDYSGFQICLPTSSVSLLFETGDTNSNTFQRTGFLASYNQIDQSACLIKDEDEACFLPEGRVVTEEKTLHSKFYPLPYPANSSCLWKILPPVAGLAVNVSAKHLDFGLWQDPFSVIDSIKIFDLSHRFLFYQPGPSNASYEWFFGVPGNITVHFQSGSLFNYHGNFELEVSFFNISTNLDLYVDQGFCVSRETPDVCRIPFVYEGKGYDVCDFLESSDEHPSCMSYRNEKIVCDPNIVACGRQFPDYTSFDITYYVIDQNITQMTISWTVNNKFWKYFQVHVNGQLYQDLIQQLSSSVNISKEVYNLRIKITVVGYIEKPKNLSVVLYPESKLQASSLDNFSTITITWLEAAYDQVLYYGTDFVNETFKIFVKNVIESKNLEGTASIQGKTEYTFSDLIPGFPYNFSFVGNSTASYDFLTIPPNPLRAFAIQQSVDWSIILSGNLTNETICLSIQFLIATETSTSDSSESRRSIGHEVFDCSFNNLCLDKYGRFTADVTSLLNEPGTCYNVTAISSSDGVNSEPSGTLRFCTPADDNAEHSKEITAPPIRKFWLNF